MLRLTLAVTGIVVLALLAPQLTIMLSWVLAFAILLMLGDLLAYPFRRRR